ncbi:hypothetical protein ACWDU8_12890 [Streptomyces sp. NPDC003388]
MQFTVLPVRGRPVSPVPGQAFLVRDDWDDYSFKTTFGLLYADPDGQIREIGGVKIGRFGMTGPAWTPLPENFETLDGAFFSLGLRDTYYERLRELGRWLSGPERVGSSRGGSAFGIGPENGRAPGGERGDVMWRLDDELEKGTRWLHPTHLARLMPSRSTP